jgi:teichuronic acid biosynthesis glycosyltransferase TuaC
VRVLAVTNLYPTDSAPAPGTFVASQIDSLRQLGVEVDLLHVDRFTGGRRVYRSLARDVLQAVNETEPDLVHVMYGGVMADVVTRKIRDRPVLVSFCGTDVLGTGGHGVVDRVSHRYGVLASRRAALRAAGIVVKARNLLAALPPQISPSRVWILPNGVDLARFRPLDQQACLQITGWSPTQKHVLFGAEPWRPEKRFALARAAVDQLGTDGDGVELHVLDGVPHEAVPSWLNAADVVLITSIHEGSPNVVKEALACNAPVVSVDVGDVRERLGGIEGCFIAASSPADLAAKLKQVLERGRRIDARDRARELSSDRIAARLCRIYEELVG